MNQHTHACIAYIACRLISGKRITFLYDISGSQEIDISRLQDAEFLKEFDEKHRDYVPGFARDCSYEYTSGSGHSIDIFINWRTFILHLRGSSAYFIGNIQRDMIYIYDHKESSHLRYRITGYADDHVKTVGSAADSGMKG